MEDARLDGGGDAARGAAGSPADRGAVERGVLDQVAGLVAELGSRAPGSGVGLDEALDRDLGIGSLERVELLLRLERAFGVRLPDAVMAEAGTPGDLAAAILAGGPVAVEAPPTPRAGPGAGRAAPPSVRTLVEALAWHAEAHPERVQVWLREDAGGERAITYGDLWREAAAVGAGLVAGGLRPGEAVALVLRTEPGFFPAFLGTLLAGGVPVPLYPPVRADRLEEYVRRHLGILRNAGARRLVTFAEAGRVAGLLRPHLPDLAEVTSVERLAARGGPAPAPRLAADGPALIQYTSGSTGDPKGVLLSHANVLANIRAIGEAIGVRPDDVGVSWLPLYHDMGLIGSWLASLYFGIPIVILSPLAFLARPSRWLWALGAHRGTMSPAPNFAFDLCARRIGDEEIQGLDLSAWRVAFNGSEAVSPDTLERFARRFAPYGLRAEALCPVYGLAEAAVALTVPPIGRGPRVLAVDRERFERAREARPAAPGAPAPLRHVACGRPIPGHEVRVVDAAGRPAPERTEGRIEFRGPSVMQGYFRNPEATRAVAREGGWLDSGDLGYWAEGDLVVTGRRKDVIIKAGRNLHPAEVEEVAGEVPGVRKGCVAAFGVPDPALGTERLVVVAETRERGAEAREGLRRQVGERVTGVLGVPPDRVVLAPPGAVLKTSSGKIRRAATRDAYVAGILERPPRAAAWQWLRLAAAARGEQGRRLAGALARAAYTAYVWLAAGVTLPVLWLLVALARRPEPADRLTRAWCRLILALAGCRLSASGFEHLAGLGPAVLVANHASYVDAVVLLAWLPAEFRFVAKRELLRWPVVGTVVRRAGHVAVERGSRIESVEDAGRVSGLLAAGTSLLIFPEGTFRRPPELLPFRLGAFKAAVEAGRPVVPVAIRGTREVLPADACLLRPARITLAVGPPIRPAGTGWPEMVRLRDLARAAIGGSLGEA